MVVTFKPGSVWSCCGVVLSGILLQFEHLLLEVWFQDFQR
jgi:hypothetical protein